MIRTVTTILLAAALAAPASAGDGPISAETVLARFVEAVGGEDALNALDERHHRGIIVQDLTWTDPEHQEKPFRAWADAKGKVRYAEVDAWSDLPDEDAADLRSKLRWIFHPRYALHVEEFFPKLRVDRTEKYEDGHLVVLVPEGLKPEYYSLYFDETTGLLVRIGYHNWLEDWREVDGVLYPHRWVFGRKGGHTTYVWDEIGTGAPPAD